MQDKDPWSDLVDFTPENSANAQSVDGGSDYSTPAPARVAPTLAPPQNGKAPTAQPSSGPVTSETETQFGDGAGMTGPHLRLTDDEQTQVLKILNTGKADAADLARAYVRARGYNFSDNYGDYVKYLQAGGQRAGNMSFIRPKVDDPSATRAGVEGAANGITLGGANKAVSAIDATSVALGLGGKGDPNQSWMNNFNGNQDYMEAQTNADSSAHPFIYHGAQLLASLALPTGIPAAAERAGFEAGADALRAGASMADARILANTAAKRAFVMRSTGEGAAYGAAGGAINSDHPGDIIPNAIEGGLLGGAGGAALSGAGSRFVRPTLSAIERGAVRPIADIASDLNVQPTPASVGGIPAVTLQTGLASVPGAASAVGNASEREVGGLGDATRRLAESYGEPGTPSSAGEALVKGATDYRNSSRAEASALYDARDAAFNGGMAPVVLRNSAKLGADLTAKLPSEVIKSLADHPIVGKILGVADNNDGEVTLNDAAEALSQVRTVKRNMASTQSGTTIARVGELENALEKDVYESAAAADQAAGRAPGAPGSAVSAQRDADAYYADRAATLKGPLGKAIASSNDPNKVSPESVYEQVAKDTAIKGGNLERLRQTWFRLPDETRGRFSATLLDDMGRPNASNRTLGDKFMSAVGIKGNDEARTSDGMSWSPETFLTNFNKMAPAARRVVFGKEGEAQIMDIARYSSKLRETGRGRNFSNTAKSAMTAGALYAVGSALTHGQLGTAAGEAAGPVGAYYGAKLFLATPAMRAWTLNALRAASLPIEKQKAAQSALLSKLTSIARAEPVFSDQIFGLQQRLTKAASASPQPAVASEGNKGPSVANGGNGQANANDNSQAPAEEWTPDEDNLIDYNAQ